MITGIVRNGVPSRWFGVLYGVKQGGVLSPILFSVYVDYLAASKTGCFIGNDVFVGVRADDKLFYWLTWVTWRALSLSLCLVGIVRRNIQRRTVSW